VLLDAFSVFHAAMIHQPQWFEECLTHFGANLVFHMGELAFAMVKKVTQ
jgi:hypothetical protein